MYNQLINISPRYTKFENAVSAVIWGTVPDIEPAPEPKGITMSERKYVAVELTKAAALLVFIVVACAVFG